MANLMFLQGVAHVVDMVGLAVDEERRDICVNLLDNLSGPPDHRAGVKYACQTLLGLPIQDGPETV